MGSALAGGQVQPAGQGEAALGYDPLLRIAENLIDRYLSTEGNTQRAANPLGRLHRRPLALAPLEAGDVGCRYTCRLG